MPDVAGLVVLGVQGKFQQGLVVIGQEDQQGHRGRAFGEDGKVDAAAAHRGSQGQGGTANERGGLLEKE